MSKAQPAHLRFSLLATSFLISWALSAIPAEAAKLSQSEAWVVRKIKAGQRAEFDEHSRRRRRTISGPFLSKLIANSIGGVKLPLRGIYISGAEVNGDFSIPDDANIQQEVALPNCHFHGTFDVATVHFIGTLVLDRSIFDRGATFRFARVDRNLEAAEALFVSSDAEADFNSVKVGANFILKKAHFSGPVDLIAATIGWDFNATDTQFKNRADFSALKVTGQALLDDAAFETAAIFTGAGPVNTFAAQRAHFSGEAAFSGMRVSNSAFFQEATFAGDTDFTSFTTGSNLEASGAHFTKADHPVLFYTIKVGDHAFFDYSSFQCGADFSYSSVGRLAYFAGAHFDNPDQPLTLTNMKVDTIDLGGTDESDAAVLSGPVRLDGLSYEHIHAQSWANLLDRANRGKHYPDTYRAMESLLLREGNSDDANQAYVLGKRRERTGAKTLSYLGNLLLDILVGYGRAPQRLLLLSAALIVVGALIFGSEKGMKTKKTKDAVSYAGTFSKMSYSLGLFLPIISLEDSKIWEPKAERRFAKSYVWIHAVLGYVLATAATLTLTGVIK
jgi:hypothetical protein